MDERVLRGMQQWPNVPDVYGWLALDERGRWRLRGEPISNDKLTAFIGRNYCRHAAGGYIFQNGPQAVHVELAYLPFVARLDASGHTLRLHTGSELGDLDAAYVDEQGRLILEAEPGPVLVNDADAGELLKHFCTAAGVALNETGLMSVLEALMAGQAAPARFAWQGRLLSLSPLNSCAAEAVFGFCQRPRKAPAG